MAASPDAIASGPLSSGPIDVRAMRSVAAELLADEATLPRFDDLSARTKQLGDYIVVLVSVVGDAAHALSDENAVRGPVLASVDGASARLAAGPGDGLVSAVKYARSLAVVLLTLCDHYENLTGPEAKDSCTNTTAGGMQ
ncbi:DUF6415 family natural product biosynthesis protein [Streptomyces odontomachi]|uniref:DUF6415 family natural product biosynthesis protein n=1 Tax=Streptomyces odontomachi TaxID=2944940 RepID=UPI00210C811D|nr:DUF6415 family natural product biosynthesis protein [Streptomyces sp. ODS25]